MKSIKNTNIYELFLNHKYKSLYNIIKDKPSLLEQILNDDFTIVQYSVQTNNKKLFKKLIELDNKQLLQKTNNNLYLPHIALYAGINDLFFDLINKFIKNSNENLLFNNNSIIFNVINRGNFNILKLFIDKYSKYINWSDLYNGLSIIYLMFNTYTNNIIDIINLLEIYDIKKEEIFKYPLGNNSLFFLIHALYDPQTLIKNNTTFTGIINKESIKKFIKFFPGQLNYEFKSKTAIYFISSYNDIDLLKFCIDLGANINHISSLGYMMYVHFIMSNCNDEIINYLLDLNINVNMLDFNNETPIYLLVRNQKSSINTITKLLKLTDSWDTQNIYGQTIIHLLATRPDIEKFYDVLKLKYFDPNIKNKFKSSVIDILEINFKNQNIDEKTIKLKINKFKKLLINSYVKALSETDSEISNDIIKNCQKNDDSCLEKLSQPSLTNLDKLSNNYNDLHIDYYQIVYYNLYNARDNDIFIYIYLLLLKYDNLGIPINENFDNSKITTLGKFNGNNYENIQHINLILSYTTKYPMLYPLNIFWIDENNYIIPYNLLSCIKKSIQIGKKFIICRISLIGYILHFNILLIDVKNKRILRFEPQGGINNKIDNIISKLFLDDIYFKDYKYFKPSDYEPLHGFQSLSQEINQINIKKGDIGGFCVVWCLWWVEVYIQNISNDFFSDSKFKLLIPKLIKKIINSGYILSEYIRNYANYMHKRLVEYLTLNILNINTIYYEKYTDSEINEIYKLINHEFSKL
jgi:hypothetical protein